ncbi:MAG: alcohol dehydrogenase catalytic domain-containing protein [Bacteroidetes bacterium]|nr:alcohol dehydrogenase catalytic domain-containing protein [Bacteroidota bacterium]
MEAVTVMLIEEEGLSYVRSSLPLESPNAEEELRRLAAQGGPVLYCITGENWDSIRNMCHFMRQVSVHLWNKGGKEHHHRFFMGGELLLIQAPLTGYDDHQRVPRALVNRLTETMFIAAETKMVNPVTIAVTPQQYAWLNHKARQQAVKELAGRHQASAASDPAVPENDLLSGNHPNAHHRYIPLPEDLQHPPRFAFIHQMERFGSPFIRQDAWGSFYVVKQTASFSHAGQEQGCPLCTILNGTIPQRSVSRFSLPKTPMNYCLFPAPHPEVDQQWTISPLHDMPSEETDISHRTAITKTDVRLMRTLAQKGMGKLTLSPYTGFPSVVPEENRFDIPCASYVDVDPERSATAHIAIQCLPCDVIPLPHWESMPWKISGLGDVNGSFSRVDHAPFYAIKIRCSKGPSIDDAIIQLDRRMRERKQGYSLLIYPGRREQQDHDVCVVVVPWKWSPAEDQHRVRGLAFLTGICTVTPAAAKQMSPVMRNERFHAATVTDEEEILNFERNLRDLFDLPPRGSAVYTKKPVRGEYFIPDIRPNTTLENIPAEIWKSSLPPKDDDAVPGRGSDEDAAPDPGRDDARILVQITHVGFSQADRRFLRGSRGQACEDRVLCREGGGYIVDPGPNHDGAFVAGRKVVFLPYRICNHCEYCRTFSGNLCATLELMGFDYDGCFRRLGAFPPHSLLTVENHFPPEAMPLVEPLACCIHALFRVRNRIGAFGDPGRGNESTSHPVTVFGSGAIGVLLSCTILRIWPSLPVLLVDPLEERREIVRRMQHPQLSVEGSFPEGHQSTLSIVCANELDAYLHAEATVSHAGMIIVFAGLNLDDLDSPDSVRKEKAQQLQRLHRKEQTLRTTPAGYTLMGSSGYNSHDLRRAIHELEHFYYAHYSHVHTATIRGMHSREVMFRGGRTVPVDNSDTAVEAYLSPEGVFAEGESGRLIRSTLKVLVTI